MTASRFRFDREGRLVKGKRVRRPSVQLTERVQQILAHGYPGQVPAVVLERALDRMAKADGVLNATGRIVTGNQPGRRT